MKRILMVLGIIFIVALCITIAKNLSSDAMAIIVGIICGIGASIPTSLLLLFLTRREDAYEHPEPRQNQQFPSVMIVTPPMGQFSQGNPYMNGMNSQGAYFPPPAGAPGFTPRQFHILGDGESNADDFWG